MNLKQEFDNILRNYGHTVALQREKNELESGPYMEIDGGRYNTTAEAWTMYRWFPRSSRTSPIISKKEGLIDDCDAVFYAQAECAFKKGDLIGDPTPNERVKRAVYRIENVVTEYLGPQLIFCQAECKKISPRS